ncbi:MAG: TadE family protein [Pseudomonadota bacterium]
MTRKARWFVRREDGSATIEFALTFPAMLMLLLSGVELGMVNLQHASLERAMDIVVREIRLGTGSTPQHDEIKTKICNEAVFIEDCTTNLRLEMIEVDPRNWAGLQSDADCTDQSEEATAVRNFVNGMDNELMVLRACAKIDPVFPTSGLGQNIHKDGAGQFALVSTTVFVQEPR